MKKLNKFFYPTVFVSFCSVTTLRSHLVQAKVYPVEEKLVGLRKTNKNRCQVCKNLIETCSVQHFVNRIHIAINFRHNFCRVRYVVSSIMVKLMTNSDTGRTIMRIIIGKVSGTKIINKQAFMLTSKQLVIMVLLMTLK